MPDGLVLDSSAALAILLDEPQAGVIEAALAAATGPILVPDLFWVEIVNMLVRRHAWAADAVVQALRELDELGPATVALDRPILLLAIDLMAARGISGYDAGYLALAETADLPLLTLDRGLGIAAGERAAIRPELRLHEERAPYGSGSVAPDWTRHGRYLAELREAARA